MKKFIDEVDEALNAPKGIDLGLDPSKRPLAGLDIEYFRSRHELQTVDVIYALCIQNSAAYNKVVRVPHLTYTMEMLIRIYDLYPSHSPWKLIEPTQAFDFLYGDVVEQFRGTEFEKEARLALYRRFTAACGRSIFTAYRWVQSGGKSKRGITKIFAKLSLLDNPRLTLETLARSMYKSRGVDFDAVCPMPSIDNPPKPKRRGPPPRVANQVKAPKVVAPPPVAVVAIKAPKATPSKKRYSVAAPRPRGRGVSA